MFDNTIPIPQRMWHLARDRRGYPVPWNVTVGKDGQAIFTVNDQHKHLQALHEGRCPICGKRMHPHVKKWFIGGPRSAFDPRGCYNDLPGHYECITYALKVCPYLAAPKYLGRVDVPNPSNLPDEVIATLDLTQDSKRPLLFVIVAALRMQVSGDAVFPYVRPHGNLLGIEYWRHGKKLTDEEGIAIARIVLGHDWNPPKIHKRK